VFIRLYLCLIFRVNRTNSSRIIFITGTDTGVGKTLLTGLLLQHLRQNGCHALAMKPFCSGSRADTKFLQAVQDCDLTLDEITPFSFPEPLAPLAAGRKRHRTIRLPEALRQIKRVSDRCPCLLIEGIGGLLVPLGEGFTVRDVIAKLGCEVVVVSPNQLGTINHTLLTVEALQHIGITQLKTVLMSSRKQVFSAPSNRGILTEMLAPVPVLPVHFLGGNLLRLGALKRSAKIIKKTLAQILG
jgi:dethiobiotin synthetase